MAGWRNRKPKSVNWACALPCPRWSAICGTLPRSRPGKAMASTRGCCRAFSPSSRPRSNGCGSSMHRRTPRLASECTKPGYRWWATSPFATRGAWGWPPLALRTALRLARPCLGCRLLSRCSPLVGPVAVRGQQPSPTLMARAAGPRCGRRQLAVPARSPSNRPQREWRDPRKHAQERPAPDASPPRSCQLNRKLPVPFKEEPTMAVMTNTPDTTNMFKRCHFATHPVTGASAA